MHHVINPSRPPPPLFVLQATKAGCGGLGMRLLVRYTCDVEVGNLHVRALRKFSLDGAFDVTATGTVSDTCVKQCLCYLVRSDI